MSGKTVGSLVDAALDRSVVLGFSAVGPAVRRRLPGWPADPEPGALRGKVAAVTGATSGLGLATAQGLLELGAAVHLVVRDTDKGARVRDRLLAAVPGGDVTVDRCDVGDAARPGWPGPWSGSTCWCTTPARCRPSAPSPRRATS
jgi:hypothetical protein